MGGTRSARTRGQRPRPRFDFFFGFLEKKFVNATDVCELFLPKQGSNYVTATEFDSAPMFIFIDPSINRMKFFLY